ncbi:MAG TPA: hypothetical protein VKH63_12095 [Candidatus Acidoferrum sp.]|jgi:predicted nucleic acid-binding protein|nr:hypothetical protein [Candidatus Acidoferrum sp.]
MIVVADTSPLNYLLQINCESTLPALYERIIVPSAVLAELAHPDTPAVVSSWLLHLPEWIDIRQAAFRADPSLALLDPGEREAIQLAQEHHAALLLIDERSATVFSDGRRAWHLAGSIRHREIGFRIGAGSFDSRKTW